MIDDLMDEPEYDEFEDRSELMGSKVCSVCRNPTAFESCGFCGDDLCPACFEMGGGFCDKAHTQEQIDEYAKAMGYEKTEAQKQAHKELTDMGIL